MEMTLSQSDVVPQLWSAYQKTKEYRSGSIAGIPAGHFLVEKQEEFGFTLIYKHFVTDLRHRADLRAEIKNRTIGEWLTEWKAMHERLFSLVLMHRGDFRTVMVRFGDVGDEDIYKIPHPHEVIKELSQLGFEIHAILQNDVDSLDTILTNLAQVHFRFIRIHPFSDGNGRIARVVTDQLASYYGLPAVMAGYPRHSVESRSRYHKAIRSCVDDPACTQLADWIRGFIEKQLETLA